MCSHYKAHYYKVIADKKQKPPDLTWKPRLGSGLLRAASAD